LHISFHVKLAPLNPTAPLSYREASEGLDNTFGWSRDGAGSIVLISVHSSCSRKHLSDMISVGSHRDSDVEKSCFRSPGSKARSNPHFRMTSRLRFPWASSARLILRCPRLSRIRYLSCTSGDSWHSCHALCLFFLCIGQ
jgi:hypothetical protein